MALLGSSPKLLENAPGFVAILEGRDHRFVFANEAYCRVVGGRPLIGRSVAEAIPEIRDQGFLEQLDQVFETGEPFTASCAEAVMEDERGELRRRFLDFLFEPITSEGTVIGIFVTGVEIPARTEEQERLLREALERLAETAFVTGTLAHEINQPLAAAQLYLAGARRLAANDEVLLTEGLKEAERQIARIGEIVAQARATAAGRCKRETIGLAPLVEEAALLVRASESCRCVPIETAFAAGAQVVHANRVQIEQVFTNLLRNACQAMTGTDAEKLLRVASRLRADGMVEIEVRDTGSGMSDIRSSPDPSARADSGMGLGLPLTRTIVEGHGGRLWWQNHAEGGASFFLTLPAPPA